MKKNFRTLGLGMMLLTALVSCKKDQTPEPLTEETSNIPMTTATIENDSYDFGTLQQGAIVQHIYEITNTGKEPLVISNVQPECGCTAPEYTKDPISPGEKGQITLSFDSKNFSGHIEKKARVYTNTENSPLTLNFIAKIQ